MMAKKKKDNDHVYDIVKEQILSLKIKPGASITENALASELGVSRTPVREALNRLESDGLIVTNNRRKRVYVLTIREVREIFDVKICLESAVARWATEKGKPQNFANLERILGEMKTISNQKSDDEGKEQETLNRWLEKDRELHRTLFEMAGNQKAEQLITTLNEQWHQLRVSMYMLEGRMERAYREHEDFVKAILEKDAVSAEAAMRLHLNNLKRELVKILNLFHYPA